MRYSWDLGEERVLREAIPKGEDLEMGNRVGRYMMPPSIRSQDTTEWMVFTPRFFLMEVS